MSKARDEHVKDELARATMDGIEDEDTLEGDDLVENVEVSNQDLVATWRKDQSLADRKLAVQKAIQSLPADQRRLIVLRFFEESTFDECAEAMGVSVNTARTLYRTACERLARLLK
jgi:RNA polymerase sigma factor (sigma-70 family)